MANVIPEKMRRDVEHFERARFILTGSVVALVCAGVAFLLLIPSYLAIMLDTRSAAPAFTVVSPAQKASDAAAIAHTNVLLTVLAPTVAASSTPTDTIQEALSLRPSGVRIDQIIYSAGTPSTLMLTGSADTNSEINAYQTALSADRRFASVSIPVGALVGTDGGRFSITLSGTF
jgi:hypothetical protein